jgi:hypothetical protein
MKRIHTLFLIKEKKVVGVRRIKYVLIATLALFLPTAVQAQIKSLTPLANYDAGENIVSYFEYLALDCPDEGACAYNQAISTPGREGHTRVAAVITGFSLWTPLPDDIGKIAVRLSATRGPTPGTVNLKVSGLFQPSRGSRFSYRVQIAVIESTVEGFAFTGAGAACSLGKCPVSMVARSAVPQGYRFLGFGLQQFDSDRKFSPLWGAVAAPVNASVDPSTGDVSASLTCGTVQSAGKPIPTLSGPCETNWVAIAVRPNSVVGGPASGLPLLPSIAPYTGIGGAAINSPNPNMTTPALVCSPHPRPSKGFVDVLAGFYLLAGQLSGSSFIPAVGKTYGMEVGVTTLGFSPSGAPQLIYRMGLPVTQPMVGGLPPAVSPLTYLRLTTSICL